MTNAPRRSVDDLGGDGDLEHGFSAIPKSVKAHRIAENFDVFDFALTPSEVAAIDALDTGVRGGADPDSLDLDNAGFPIPG